MDAFRRGSDVWVHIDLPGVKADSLDITVERNVLTIAAERNWQRQDGDQAYFAERYRGSFRRQIELGDGLDLEHLEADLHDGVLTVRIPVAEQAKLSLETVRQRFTDSGQMSDVRSSIQKNKALEWLIERVEIVDPDGTVIDRTALEAPESASDQTDETTAETTSEPSDEQASQAANEDAQ